MLEHALFLMNKGLCWYFTGFSISVSIYSLGQLGTSSVDHFGLSFCTIILVIFDTCTLRLLGSRGSSFSMRACQSAIWMNGRFSSISIFIPVPLTGKTQGHPNGRLVRRIEKRKPSEPLRLVCHVSDAKVGLLVEGALKRK
jgi:hypothetical protein